MAQEKTIEELIDSEIIGPDEQEDLLNRLDYIDDMDSKSLKEYTKEVVSKLSAPPMEEHPVVGESEFKGQRVLIVLKDRTRLMVGDFIGFPVPIGENVWVHKKANVAIAPSGRQANGRVATIKSIRPNQALIVNEHEERWLEWDAKRLGEPRVGYKVSILDDWITIVRSWEDPTSIEVSLKPKERYTDIGGLEDVIYEVKKTIDLPRMMPNAYAAFGIKRSGSILLHGPPGGGKTLIARAIAGENNMAFYGVKVSDIYSKWVGDAESRIREIFVRAKEHQPSIIFFDEFDALGNARGDGEVNHVYNSITAELLQQMDGLEDRGDVILIAATNQINLVDAAFKRHGRFDKIIEVPRPNRKGAKQIAKIHLPDSIPADNINEIREHIVDKIMSSKLDISGALIRGLCDQSKVEAIIRAQHAGQKNPILSVQDVDTAAEIVLDRK